MQLCLPGLASPLGRRWNEAAGCEEGLPMAESIRKSIIRVERVERVERWSGGERVDLPSVSEATESEPRTGGPIPGSAEDAAEKVNQTSHVEGRPALGEAKDGPARMQVEIVLAAVVVVLAAVGVGVWFGPWAGLAAMAVGLVGLAFNPVIGAMTMRMKDRAAAARGEFDEERRSPAPEQLASSSFVQSSSETERTGS